MKLAENFSLAELTKSQTAERKGMQTRLQNYKNNHSSYS